MLRHMRKGVFSGLFLLLLVLGAAGLILTDAGGFFSSGIRTSEIAKAGSITVNSRPFDTKIRRLARMQGIELDQAYDLGIVHQVLFKELQNLLMLQGANDLGIAISDTNVTKMLEALLEPYMRADTTSKKSEVLSGLLRQNGTTEAIFIEDLRTESTNNILMEAIQSGVQHAPKQLVADIEEYSHEARNIQYMVFKNDDTKLDTPADDETLERYYKSYQDRYRVAEKRDFTIAVITQDQMKKDMKISDDEARAYYDENMDSYTKPRQHKIAQAIADNEGDALKIKDKAVNGKPLSTAAKLITGDAANFIDTQGYAKGDLPESLDTPAFDESVKKGDIIGPFETALGWHVLKVVEIIEPLTPEYAELKDNIKRELLDEALWETVDSTISELEDRIFGGESAANLIAEYKMQDKSIKSMTRQGYVEDSKDSPLKDYNSQDAIKILDAVNKLGEGENSEVLQLNDSSIGFVVVEQIHESFIRPFEDVKALVKTQWTKEQKDSKTYLTAKDLSDKLNEETASFKEIAKTVKPKLKKASISRNADLTEESASKDLNSGQIDRLLNGEIKKAQVLPGADKTILAYIVDSSLINGNSKKAESNILTGTAIAQNLKQESLALYYDTLQKDFGYQINEDLLKLIYRQKEQ